MIYGTIELIDGTKHTGFYEYSPVHIGQEFVVNGNGQHAYVTKVVTKILEAKPSYFKHAITGVQTPMPRYAFEVEVKA